MKAAGKHPFILGIIISVIIITIWLSIGMLLKGQRSKAVHLTNGTLFSSDYKIQPFEFVDDNGKAFTIANLKGHWSMLFFGFTRCPMMCPTTMTELNKTYHALKKENLGKNLPQVIFISVDPEHDTPTVMKNYIAAFNTHFIGVTGTKSQIDRAI